MQVSSGGAPRARALRGPFRAWGREGEPAARFGAWTAPALAAAVVLVSALPGLLALPPLDRDEARFAQSTAQMLETGDFVDIRYRDMPRDKKPVGINWLQALSVSLVSSAEQREIWAYRLPSLAAAMAAAAACAWGAMTFVGRRGALLAGVVLGASLILSSEAFIAKTDATLCFGVTLSMAALARVYDSARRHDASRRRDAALFWVGQALAILVKGPIGPMVAALTMLGLLAADRQARWLGRLGWGWGLLFLALVLGPWAVAITISTDGAFWSSAVIGDLAPKLTGGHETHGMAPGYHLLLAPVLLFPSTFLLPAALVYGWRRRQQVFARFALAWLVPSWLVFEAAPTKLAHYTLPLFAALAWLAAGALGEPAGRWSRWIGAGLSGLIGVALAVTALVLAARYGGPGAEAWAAVGAALALGAGAAGVWAALTWTALGRTAPMALACAIGFGVATHIVLTAGLAPRLDALWLSQRAAELIKRAGLDPRNGLTIGPVAVAGYAEPSLVFALGTETEIDDGVEAAQSLAYGQPALVESRQAPAFLATLKREGLAAQAVGQVRGFDYSDRKRMVLTLWRATSTPEPPAGNAPRPTD